MIGVPNQILKITNFVKDVRRIKPIIGYSQALRTTVSVSTADNTDHYEFYKNNHIPINWFQRCALTVGSCVTCLLNPNRGDMIAVFGEAAGQNALAYMEGVMQSNNEGMSILQDKPRISSKTVDLNKLASLPEGTMGRVYYDFLVKNKVTPDTRSPVQFVDDVEHAYIMQRYREVHDLVHALLYQPTDMLGEVTIKWVEAFQTRLPMCSVAALFGAVRLAPKQRKKYVEVNLPWAIKTGINSRNFMNIYFEKRWEQPVKEIYEEYNITPIN